MIKPILMRDLAGKIREVLDEGKRTNQIDGELRD
jgi:hypothetical protein